jgi:hypothetical protein
MLIFFLIAKHGSTNKTGPSSIQPFFLFGKELKTLGHMIWTLASNLDGWF